MGVVGEHTEAIDGVVYKTRTFPATVALDLGQRMAALIPENALTLILGVDTDELGGVLTDPALMLDMARMVARGAPAGELSAFCKALLTQTTCEQLRVGEAVVAGNVAEHFDTHFSGRLGHLLWVCVWVARVGFGGP